VRAGFEHFILSLPATTLVRQWGDSSVAKVGGKVFALLGVSAEGASLTFKVSEMAFEMLTGLDGVGQAPYFAKGHWVAVTSQAALGPDDVAAYLGEAHRLVAAGLTRKLRTELGLEGLVAAGPRAG
jgi:predicted DNA-binding protein (MmcQ/YjbR family)